MPRITTGLYNLLALCCLGSAALADSVWQWTDEQGRQHFSDTPPATETGLVKQIESANDYPADPVHGLRSGEIERLRRMEQRSARLRQKAASKRQRNDRILAEHRSTCQETRAHMHSTHDRSKRKEYSNYLRKNCW
jgi:hypothetical protein